MKWLCVLAGGTQMAICVHQFGWAGLCLGIPLSIALAGPAILDER